jgi:hypothetical protein
MAEKCSNCKFYQMANLSEGRCRRHAPVILPQAKDYVGVFPLVESNTWCGDYISKKL